MWVYRKGSVIVGFTVLTAHSGSLSSVSHARTNWTPLAYQLRVHLEARGGGEDGEAKERGDLSEEHLFSEFQKPSCCA